MTAIVATVAYLGLEPRAVEVQVQLIPGLPAFQVVGLADKAVAESRERVRGAVAAMGLAQERADGRFDVTEDGRARHASEIMKA